MSPGTEGERDPEQVRQAIEGVRALLPVVEPLLGPDGAQIREALSQLQLAYTKIAAGAEPAPAGQPPEPKPDDPGPAESSGRLWVPGQ